MINSVLNIRLHHVLLAGILSIGTFLLFYKLNQFMMFIGDFGWFYLSARDMLLTGDIPVVGITSSRTWLHQGPLWTYVVAVIFQLSQFNPFVPGYFTAFLGVLNIFLIYYLGRELFSTRLGLHVSLLYATSPLIIVFSRMPYHISPIPTLAILFLLFLYKWVKGEVMYFPFIVLIISLLYNFELAAILFVFVVLLFFFYGVLKKKKYIKIFRPKILLLSLLFFVIPLFPILIYDFHNGFPQTVKFPGWVVLQGLKLIGIEVFPNSTTSTWNDVITFFLFQYKRLAFLPNQIISTGILLVSIVGSGIIFLNAFRNRKKTVVSYLVLCVTSFVLLAGFFFAKTPSEAYLPMVFPYLILLIGVVVNRFLDIRILKYGVTVVVGVVVLLNITFLLQKEYFSNYKKNTEGFVYGPGMEIRIQQAQRIVNDADGKPFQLQGGGFYTVYDSSIDNYKYLVWWLDGNIQEKSSRVYTIYDGKRNIDNMVFSDEYITVGVNK